MPHSIPEYIPLKGKYNKPVKKGRPRRITEGNIGQKSFTKTSDASETIDKPIQVYRQWYRFLQLAIELEDVGASIITREVRVPLAKPKKDEWGHLRKSYLKPTKHKVKINWKKYKGWGNPETILNTDFDAWWKQHRNLFFSDTSKIMKDKKEWVDDPVFKYMKIDTRKRSNDIASEIKQLLDNMKRTPTSISAFPVTGQSNIRTLQNRYNALVLKISTKKTDKELLMQQEFFRSTQIGMTEYETSSSVGRTMRDLMLPAKITLLSVCDGYFVKRENRSRGATALTSDDFSTAEGSTYSVASTTWSS